MERSLYSERQFLANLSFLNSIAKTVESVSYICKYAPVIVAEAKGENLFSIAEMEEVVSILYAPQFKVTTEMDISLPLIRADYVRDTLSYSGNGIKVGVLDKGNIDTSAGFFNNSHIIFHNSSIPSSFHTTLVASIIASTGDPSLSNPLEGIAPSVTIYCRPMNDLYSDIEWLLDKGVHIINMSMQLSEVPEIYSGHYTSYEKWIDHIAINHSVHFVKSAGNSDGPSYYVTHPGLAYNIITVGAIDDKNTALKSDDTIATFSCYQEYGTVTNKPDICAPGVLISTSYFPSGYLFDEYAIPVDGTSFAAPHVTGVIAQILDAKPALIALQDTVKAILAASVYDDHLQYQSSDTAFGQYGAGLIDSRGSVYTSRQNHYANSYFSANCNSNSYQTFQFTVSSSDTMKRIALSWLVNSKITGTHTSNTPSVGTMPNLDIEIYNPSGTKVGWCYNLVNNLDVIQLNNPVAGTYTAKVICVTPSDKKTYFSVAWY